MIPANNHPEIDRLIHLKKHLGGMTMSKLISCQFNTDTACVELVFDDGSQISIDCTAVENEVADNRFQRSELDYLICNDPLAYADLILNSKLNVLFEQTDMSINDSVPVHNDWAAAYYIIVFCELIPRTDTEDIRNPLLSSLRKAQSAGPHR